MNGTTGAVARPLSQFLRLAVVTGIARAVQVHIDRGDDLNARDGKGQTPLMLAAARNKAAICKLLLDAGADASLQDPAGKTAHDIAIAVRAHDAASVIAESQIQMPEQAPALFVGSSETASTFELPEHDSPNTEVERNTTSNVSPSVGVTGPQVDLGARQSNELAADWADVPMTPAQFDDEQKPPSPSQDEELEFDLSEWFAEDESVAPAADPTIAAVAVSLQGAISLHVPIDSSDGWDDIDAFLPDRATPLTRAADPETRLLLRHLLLRAIREKVASNREIDELSTDDDGTPNFEARALLLQVVNDLGAEVDDWVGPNLSPHNFELNTQAESSDEEALLDEAFSFIDSASSHRNEPLRAYQREFQHIPLITADEEVSFAQAMERALGSALDALAAWPEGIARVLSAGAAFTAGHRPISWMSRGDSEPDPEGDGETECGPTADVPEDSDGDKQASSESLYISAESSFVEALNTLEELGTRAAADPSKWEAVRAALSSLNLSRGFLLVLADNLDATLSEERAKYLKALAEYQKARDAMACANLKLSFHIAKKYLYSGVSLDDLIQEANLGLLKAVDKYDWRRGFKFSTYATWWIRQQVSRAVADKSRTIRVPVHIFEKLQRVRRAAEHFESAHGRPAKAVEVAEHVGMPTHKAAGLMRLLPEPVCLHDISIDQFIAVGAQDAFIQEDPMEIASTAELTKAVRCLLDALDSRESRILCLRYGIGNQEPLTLEEVGQCYGVTRERIRQIESKLFKKLRVSVQFAREALDVDNSESSRRRHVSRNSNGTENLLANDKAEEGGSRCGLA